MNLRILVTGARSWTDGAAIRNALIETIGSLPTEFSGQIMLIHGAARGADTLAARIARELGWTVEPYPCTRADWARYGKSAGHRRNAAMVAAGADVCVAFPLGESRGTRGCMELAIRAGIPVLNYGDERSRGTK